MGNYFYITYCEDVRDGSLSDAIGRAGLWQSKSEAEWACYEWFVKFVAENPWNDDWSEWNEYKVPAGEYVNTNHFVWWVNKTYPQRVRIAVEGAPVGENI